MARRSVASLLCSTAVAGLLSAAPSYAQQQGGATALTSAETANQTTATTPGASPAEAAQSQTSQTAGHTLQEVVVTAQRRSETLDKVPVSISAYTEATLDKENIKTFQDVARITPGVTFSPGFRGNTSASSLAIRGIQSSGGTATVGVYIDDTPVQVRPDGYQSSNPYPHIFDLDRVEVLRGPQGTLFGAGSEGGTVRFILPEPSLTTYSAYGRSELASTQGGDPSYEAGAAVGGPIIDDTLGFRASVWYRRDGGYVDRVNWYTQQVDQPNSNWDDAKTARLALKWKPTPSLTVEPSIFYQDSFTNDSSNYWEAFSDPSKGEFKNGNPLRTPTDDAFYLPALKLQYDLGQVMLISNTSYLSRNKTDTYDSTTLDEASFAGIKYATPPESLSNTYAPGYLYDKQHVLTQEIRAQNSDPSARLNWVAGVFYQHTGQDEMYDVQDTFINQFIAYGIGPLTVQDIFGYPLYNGVDLLASHSHLSNDEVAFYTQEDLNITTKLKVTAGVRVASDSYKSTAFGAGPVESSNGFTTVVSESATPVTPKFGASYQVDRNNLIYASAARGYRQGLADSALGERCAGDAEALGLPTSSLTGQTKVAPDYVWSYEAGAKDKLLGNRLQVETSVYKIDWDNIQSSITLPNCNIPTTLNLGSATSQGFDLQASAAVTENLTMGIAVGYTDAHYTTTTRGAGGAVIRSAGQPLGAAPWTVALNGEYDFDVFGRKSYAQFDYQFASHDNTPLDLASSLTDPTIPRPPAINNLDLRLGMKFEGYDVSLFAANVTNEDPELTRYRDTLTSFVYRGQTVRPRTVGITVLYRY